MTSLRWGVLGTGMAARDVATAIQLVDGSRVAAVGSESAERGGRFAADFDIERSHSSHAELLADPDLDAVYIASDPSAHHNHAIAALETGKAVLLEKPFAVDAAQARSIIDAARRTSTFCMEAMWTRFNPTVQRVLKLVSDGAIGTVMHVDASLGFDRPITHRDHRFDPNRGGGALLDLGVYPISLVAAMLGAPNEVEATATLRDDGIDLDNGALLRFPTGAWATISSSLRAQGRNDMVIVGTEGRLIIEAPVLNPTRYRLVPRSRQSDHPGSEDAVGKSIHMARRIYRRAGRELNSRPRRLKVAGNGYEYQVVAAAASIQAGELECATMPWHDTVLVMQVLDEVREAWAT